MSKANYTTQSLREFKTEYQALNKLLKNKKRAFLISARNSSPPVPFQVIADVLGWKAKSQAHKEYYEALEDLSEKEVTQHEKTTI